MSEVSFVMSDKRESESDLGPGLSSISPARKRAAFLRRYSIRKRSKSQLPSIYGVYSSTNVNPVIFQYAIIYVDMV